MKDAEAGEEGEPIQKGCTEKRTRHGQWKQSQQATGDEVGMQNENMNTSQGDKVPGGR